MANDYRILDERDIKNFQAGNKLEVTEIGNKVTYKHIGEPPNTLPSKEKVLEYGDAFNITVPSVYDSTGHVKSETKYTFIMPEETDTSNFLTTDNFLSESPISVNKSGKNVTYSHDEVSMTTIIPDLATQLTYGGTFEIPALSAADGYGHATEQKTYKFQMPKAVDVSGYIKKDSFGSIDDNPVVKGENDKKQIAYSHKTLDPTSNNPPTVNLEYDKEFQFIALSATDGYGHANQNTTYKFKMPKASTTTINTSEFLTKENFKNIEPILVNTEDGNVTYSHKTFDKTSSASVKLSPKYGERVSFTAISDLDNYGHVSKKASIELKMPQVHTLKEEMPNTYYHSERTLTNMDTFLDTTGDLLKTSICFITFFGSEGYSSNNNKIIFPGIFTLPFATYAQTVSQVEYPLPALQFNIVDSTVSNVQKVLDNKIIIQLQTRKNGDNNEVYLHITFPMNVFERIDITGF